MTILTIKPINCGTALNSLPTTVYDLNHIDSLPTAVYIKEAVIQPIDADIYPFFDRIGLICFVVNVSAMVFVLFYIVGCVIYYFTRD
jgi:hypothetical protein